MDSNPFQNTALHAAVEQGDPDRVHFLLQKGDDPNTFRIDGYTPLHCAVSIGQSDIAEMLLQQGSDPNRRRPKRTKVTMPIHLAVENGQYDLVRTLLDAGADPNCVSRWNKTPLWLALELHLLSIARLIEDRGGRILACGNAQDAINAATGYEHLFVMEHLLQAGAKGDVTGPSKWMTSALFCAITSCRKRAVKLLLERGADPNKICAWIPEQRQFNREEQLRWIPVYPINLACSDRTGDIAEMLIRAKARFDQPGGFHHRTPAADASICRCDYRIESDGTVTRRQRKESSTPSWTPTGELTDYPGYSPLHKAVLKRDRELVDHLLRNGEEINDRSRPGWCTPLIFAIETGQTEMVRFLLERGANPFLRSSMRWTPLMKAVWWGRYGIPSPTAERDELTAIMLEYLPCESS